MTAAVLAAVLSAAPSHAEEPAAGRPASRARPPATRDAQPAVAGQHATDAAGHADLPVALLDATADTVLSRVIVPDPTRRVGEVRLVARGNAVVVQTLLATKVLGRVVAEIHKKEEAGWPPASAGQADSRHYLDALDAVQKAIESRQPAVSWAERRRRMLIEFVADDSSAGVILGSWSGDDVDGALNPAERSVMTLLVPGRPYVLRNMRLILADSFHLPDADLDRLGALGPLRGVSASAASQPAPAAPPASPSSAKSSPPAAARP